MGILSKGLAVFSPCGSLVLTQKNPWFVGSGKNRGAFSPRSIQKLGFGHLEKNNGICPKIPILPEQGFVNNRVPPRFFANLADFVKSTASLKYACIFFVEIGEAIFDVNRSTTRLFQVIFVCFLPKIDNFCRKTEQDIFIVFKSFGFSALSVFRGIFVEMWARHRKNGRNSVDFASFWLFSEKLK